MATDYPVNSADVLPEDFMSWANESYELAITYVYPGFVTRETPSTEYQITAKPVLTAHMMLGAARLANLIESIYG